MTALYNLLNKMIEKISSINTNKVDATEIETLNGRIERFEENDFITSDQLPTDHISSDEVRNIVKMTESEFEGLDTKNANTLYVIVEDDPVNPENH